MEIFQNQHNSRALKHIFNNIHFSISIHTCDKTAQGQQALLNFCITEFIYSLNTYSDNGPYTGVASYI